MRHNDIIAHEITYIYLQICRKIHLLTNIFFNIVFMKILTKEKAWQKS